ncbi:MAG: carboxypeptidase M32 [Fidelibacterota bacterium]|nr:MAG: carboxypeptidase M32 [Candidatus Neomarinimicrobiota bacterium]
MNRNLDILIREMRIITQLRSVAAVLSWDQETYMPPGSARARANQISLILSMSHARFIGPDFRHSLSTLVDLPTGKVFEDDLAPEEVRLLEMTWRDWRRATALPVEFVGELARLTAEAQHIWEQARRKNDFGLLAPYLEKIISMKRDEADYLGYDEVPYDALIDGYEPGMTTEKLQVLFDTLRPALVDLVTRIQATDVAARPDVLARDYDEAAQQEFGMDILRDMGYDLTRGRRDHSAHPFTTNFHPSDVRITTRLRRDDLTLSLFGTLHEGGHALYEQALNEDYFGTPLCESISLGIHESQSRLWENYVGRSRPFWKYYYPRLQQRFSGQLNGVSLQDFYAAVNAVAPSTVRTEADEVTYNLHIMLRFELEQAMINDSVAASDLPARWNKGMEEFLGVRPQNDAEGVLQDIHWSMGAIGYFPTYTLGNLYGLQFYEAAKDQIAHLEEKIAMGDLGSLREWLRENIHQVGRAKTADELVRELTGGPLSAEPFIHYLEQKYGELYGAISGIN